MFPECENLSGAKSGSVLDATVNSADRVIEMRVRFDTRIPPVYINMIEDIIKREYALNDAKVIPVFPSPPPVAPSNKSGTAIFGKPCKHTVIPMNEVTENSGRIAVTGRVFAVNSREVRNGAFVLSFDMTDDRGSVRVTKYISKDKPDMQSGAKKIEIGKYYTVYGDMDISKFDGEILDPISVMLAEPPEKRRDECAEKRVELHLHTKMSAMDATTDTAAAVKRAIEWGHRAIAITDHGVCQSFPDAMKAAGDKIKILYGVEGYFINDVNDKPVVCGKNMNDPIPDEFVAFDLETTGLSSAKDVIIEIGAVRFSGGREVDRFQTFVDPKRGIPDSIVKLTGITDEMVSGAPTESEAVRSFLSFAGDLPLCAHNAPFDIGFIDEACTRCGYKFDPTYIDTVPLSQALLPEMRSHKLDLVAGKLGLPEFNHHRASDDAFTCGLILVKLLERLSDEGIAKPDDINSFAQAKRSESRSRHRVRPYHIIIIAKTQTGIKNLYKIISQSHLKYFRKPNPIIPKSLLMEYREGLIIGSACEAGEVFRAVSDHGSKLEQRRIAEFYDYLEIQPICNNMFMLRGEKPKARDEEQLRDFNRRVVQLGKELGKPVVATGDVHFLDPEDEIFRHILLTSKEYDDADKPLPIYFKTTDEMLREFSYLGEETAREVVITNTNMIADMCDTLRPLPPAGKLFAPKIENSEDQLKELVYTKMRDLYGENPPEIVTDRVEQELHDILSRHYDVIYMSAQKLVQDSLKHNYLVGSRGSVGSSLVAFMSGITEVNSLPPHYRCPKCKNSEFITDGSYGCGADMPDKICPVCGTKYDKDGFDIPFETFLGFGGDKVPDIDLNFSGEYQANAHRYTTELFGADHVFRAGTIGGVAEKTAYGYVLKYLEKTGKTANKAEEQRLALGCVGVKRTTGQHPGGLVVIPQDMEIEDFCPVQHPADDEGSDIITTHFEYHCMEENLLKLDELGHDDPTMIRMLEEMTGVDARKIPLDDPETMGIFKSPKPLGLDDDDPIIGKTGTIGIPEFGTGFTRQMLVDTKPEEFSILVRLSGFAHGTDVWLGNAQDLILSNTATVNETIGCRDDIMLFLMSKGMEPKKAFKIMEAVRKGKVKKAGFQDDWLPEMKRLGVPDWYIESLEKIAYLFPKAHAVAYVMMAFRIAWFKVHYPLQFYSAYFYRRSQKGSFDASIMTVGAAKVRAAIDEIKDNPNPTAKDDDIMTTLEACWEFYKRGFRFLPIDLYRSDPVKFTVEDGALRPPFVSVSGLGDAAAYDLAAHRGDTEFVSIEELASTCTKVSKAHIEQLSALGALGNMPETSQMSLF